VLKGNGQLLIEVKGLPFEALFSATVGAPDPPLTTLGYAIEPLFPAQQTTAAFSVSTPGNHWLLAKPKAPASSGTPWDDAHALAKANGYTHYVEPDILHEAGAATAVKETKDPWPPHQPVSAGWHLFSAYAGFADVRAKTTGAGVRIAHLDTGFTKGLTCEPRRLLPDLGWDFWDGHPGAEDPHTGGFLLYPGHGTATLALLAGPKMNLPVQTTQPPGTIQFDADFGGAPDAEVVPVRISPSVIHLATSSMALGVSYALAPRGSAANRCDVITCSHGGLPARPWARAVNDIYEAGLIMAAASGDNYNGEIIGLPTRFTVYPAAFNRVITVTGATYDRTPYIAPGLGEKQENWGPAAVMEKAIAAYTPKVAWMNYTGDPVFTMDGAGTSASTPQVAAACALWLSLYGPQLPKDWRRVEACRVALFESAADKQKDKVHLGWGVLNVPRFLDKDRATDVIARALGGKLKQSGVDEVSFPLWRLLFGWAPPNSEAETMYEVEAAQVVLSSTNGDLIKAAQDVTEGGLLTDAQRSQLREALLDEPISSALRERILAAK
jgi:hypothetical protein